MPKWSDSSCETVIFPPYRFYPEKQVRVQITVTHMNLNDSETVHDAVTSWIEDSNTKNFTVCAMQSGRKSRNFNPFATIIWVAYQGAPPNGMTGIIKMQEWWSGTKCAKVTFSKVSLENVRCCVHFFIFFVSNYNKHNVAQKWSCLIFYFFFQLFSFFPRSVFLGVFL